MNEMWRKLNANMRQYVSLRANGPTLQFLSCAEKDSLCGTVMMAWNVWINAMMLAPTAQAPPEAGAKELLYSLGLTHEFRSLFLRR